MLHLDSVHLVTTEAQENASLLRTSILLVLSLQYEKTLFFFFFVIMWKYLVTTGNDLATTQKKTTTLLRQKASHAFLHLPVVTKRKHLIITRKPSCYYKKNSNYCEKTGIWLLQEKHLLTIRKHLVTMTTEPCFCIKHSFLIITRYFLK